MNEVDALLPGGPPPAEAVPIHVAEGEARASAVKALGAVAEAYAGALHSAEGETLLLPGADGRLAGVVVASPGPDDPFAPLQLGRLARSLPHGAYRLASEASDPCLAALGWAMGGYRYTRYRPDSRQLPALYLADDGSTAEARRLAEGVALARDLINTPASDMGPREIAGAAEELADRHGARFGVTVGDDLLAAGLPMIHAVGRASPRAPCLVDFTWGDEAAPKVTLVGKGVAFDTGGLDLKTSAGMALMKKDMGGAANVLGLASMLMRADAPVRLRVLLPAVENSVSGAAFRPGDVLKSRKGFTVEIGNTDAEGRLILADALALADEESPDLLVDMATLTGAARVALGPDLPPYYTRHDTLAADFEVRARALADPVWRLPLWQPYDTWLKADTAEIDNAPGKPFAGSIVAALFLARFVGPQTPWMHFDIYGWAQEARPHGPKGGEAQAIRALDALVRARFER